MRNILITGSPGIGKTLVKKIIEEIKSKGIECNGFYTEEVAEPLPSSRKDLRKGFDIVALEGRRGVLARKHSANPNHMPKVGQYLVYVNEFEEIALPILTQPKKLMFIDEIGKMEMFCPQFIEYVRCLFDNKDVKVVATVPEKGPVFVKQLKERRDCLLIRVDHMNRNNLLDQIVKLLLDPLHS